MMEQKDFDMKAARCTERGFGHQGPASKAKGITAVSHADGICLKSSVWIDGQQIMDTGRLVHPELARFAKKLGKE
jgi:2,5-dihydroxypyridine 5,6-dioxygenase